MGDKVRSTNERVALSGLRDEPRQMCGRCSVPRLDHPFPSWSFIWVKESIVFAARVMEQSFTWMNGWFDLSQGRGAPAREASGPSRGSPRCRGYRGGAVAVRGGRVAGGYGYRGAYRAGA